MEETDVCKVITKLYKKKGVSGQAEVRKALQQDLSVTPMRISQIMRSEDLSSKSITKIAQVFGMTKKQFLSRIT